MKVACICNMNNNFFTLVRYLRDRGVEADLLLLNDELSHFHPSCDTYDLGYQQYTKTLSWGQPYGFSATHREQVLQDLKEYDFLIGCGSSPAFANKIGRNLDIFNPYGTDLFSYPYTRLMSPKYQIAHARFARNQKMGIQNSNAVLCSPDVQVDNELAKIQFKKKRIKHSFPMVYSPTYNPDTISEYYNSSHWYREFKKIRANHDLMIFHQARHIWKDTSDPVEVKRNDILFRGFSDYINQTVNTRSCIVTCEYGGDVFETKKLIHELGIKKQVFWFPQMMRKDLMIGLNLSDIGTGEFNLSWLISGAIHESLAMAKPLMHYREDPLYSDNYKELYPMINVKSAEDVAKALHDYENRPDYYREMGKKGQEWFQLYGVDLSLGECMKLIEGH